MIATRLMHETLGGVPIGVALLAGLMLLPALAIPAEAEPSKPADEVGFFAIGACAANTKNLPRWIPLMTAIGIRDMRNVGGAWGGVEAVPGKWDFSGFQERLAYLESQKVRTGMLLMGTPPWYSDQKPRGLPVKDIEGWKRYVSKVVEHGKGCVKYYAVWNEPPNGTNNAPASDYAKIVVAAYDAAKAVDPTCMIGLAAKSAHVNYLDQVIVAGAKGHFDYITLHPYELLGCVERRPGTEQVFMRIAATVRKMLAARDPGKVDCPIWFTELGYDSKRGEDHQAAALVKGYTLALAQGITTINWFEGMDGDSGPMGIVKGDGTPRPAYHALARMIELLGQHPKPLGWVLFNDKHYGFIAKGPQQTVLTTWAATEAPDTIRFAKPVKIVDPVGGGITESDTARLTTMPIFIDGVPEDLLKQAEANRGKPFPWGGDYTDAQSVSIVMGADNVEKGLHTQSAQGVAEDVLAYGGNARAGGVPGGNVFMVDSNFLSYAATPIEISAVVRRNPNNAPAKLVLEYESTSGYKKAPEFDIPDNKTWHTATWKIDDAQFVGTWAFNFRFNIGPYFVKSVSVRKLDR